METAVPFTGFYETHHMARVDDSVAYHYFGNDPDELDAEESDLLYCGMSGVNWEVDWGMWKKEYCEQYLRDFCKYVGIEMEYVTMQSPKEYNFRTDRIFANVSLESVKMMRAAVGDYALHAYIIDHFTSYDGFSSFYSNRLADWDAKPMESWDHNEVESLLNVYFYKICEDKGHDAREEMYELGS